MLFSKVLMEGKSVTTHLIVFSKDEVLILCSNDDFSFICLTYVCIYCLGEHVLVSVCMSW